MYDVIIIGAGVSGLMCATTLKNKKILILEKNNKAGKKLLITGGGRCNLTNLISNNEFINNISHNNKYLYSCINAFGPNDIYNYFNKFTDLKVEDNNKVFPRSNKSYDILNVLIKDVEDKIVYNEEVLNIKYVDNNIEIVTKNNKYISKKLVVATGGSSYKNTGSTGDHIKFCKLLNQPVIDLYPAEVGLTINVLESLSATSFDNVVVSSKKIKKEGSLIFTHKGLSGEAIMNMSEYVYLNDISKIYIDFLPNIDKEELDNEINSCCNILLKTILNKYFTKKFSKYLLDINNILDNELIKHINKNKIKNIISNIKNMEFEIIEKPKLDFAYVTGGGVDLKYINTMNFESKINKNIYFIGECLDLHGKVGGYNITIALSTGYKCGSEINKCLN